MMDLTTHNHASQGPNAPPMVYFDGVAIALPEVCREQAGKCSKSCSGTTARPPRTLPSGKMEDDGQDCTPDCASKQKCILVPKKNDKQSCCHPDTTGHHMIEDHWIKGNIGFYWYRSDRGSGSFAPQSLALTDAERSAGIRTIEDAPCVCAPESRSDGTHQEMHNVQAAFEESYRPGGARHDASHSSWGFTYGAGKSASLNAHDAAYSSGSPPENVCDRACLEAQLDAFYGGDNARPLNKPHRLQPIGRQHREATNRGWSGIINGGR